MTQETALAILKTGQNVFLTGEPGAGKTYTVNQYTKWLREHDIDPAITASTGIAATHIGGMTIHSWSGIGIKKWLSGEDYTRMRENDKLMTRLMKTSVLIIDEISMLDARTLDAVDGVCRALRQDGRAFGGIQIVFVGDFFQLPPVSRSDEPPPQFAYRSQAWTDAAPTVCYLSEQHRQQDGAFLSLLASLRRGRITAEGLDLLHERQAAQSDDETHTRLYSHNMDVDRMNQQRLLELDGDPLTFRMDSFGGKNYVESLKKSCLSPEFLILKVGSRVMFTKNNFEEGYVNGTLGEIEAFESETPHAAAEGEEPYLVDEEMGAREGVGMRPIVRTLDGRRIAVSLAEWSIMDGSKILGKIKQFPLRLAWAITVHKSQGMTLDAAVMDLSQAFEYGQGYVALSRVKASSGLYLLGWNERSLQVHPQILTSDEAFRIQAVEAQASHENVPAELQREMESAFIQRCGGSFEIIEREAPDDVDLPKKEKRSAAPKGATYLQTLSLFREGKSLAEIAEARGLVLSTICNHIEKLAIEGKVSADEVLKIVPERLHDVMPMLHEALKAGEGHLGPAYEKLRGRYSYDDLRFARMLMG